MRGWRVREGATVTLDDVTAFCSGRIAHYKVPHYVHITIEFPMTVTGKVQKFLMRQAAIEQLGPGRCRRRRYGLKRFRRRRG